MRENQREKYAIIVLVFGQHLSRVQVVCEKWQSPFSHPLPILQPFGGDSGLVIPAGWEESGETTGGRLGRLVIGGIQVSAGKLAGTHISTKFWEKPNRRGMRSSIVTVPSFQERELRALFALLVAVFTYLGPDIGSDCLGRAHGHQVLIPRADSCRNAHSALIGRCHQRVCLESISRRFPGHPIRVSFCI